MKLKFNFRTAKHIVLCCFFFVVILSSNAQQIVANDSIPLTSSNMSLIKIEAEAIRRIPVFTSGSVGIVHERQLKGNDQTSLQNALNTVPGVTMESRGYGGSQRINVRGSFLRSPFAVRNIKLYVEGIPMSSPDGTTPLEVIDAFDITGIEVVKGPNGSYTGSGTSGVIYMRLAKANPKRKVSFKHSTLFGSYGMKREATAIGFNTKKWNTRVSHIFQENRGYRDQEFNRKNNVSVISRYTHNEKRDYTFYASYFDGQLALPGGLNTTQAEEDPTQANSYSIANNASLYRERLLAAVSQNWVFSEKFYNTTSIYGSWTQKYNPYGTSSAYSRNGFKDEGALGTGTRSVFKLDIFDTGIWRLRSTFGGEVQFEKFDATEHTNVGGKPGDLKYKYDVDYLTLLGFVGTTLSYKDRVFVDLSASSNKTNHQITAQGYQGIRIDSNATWAAQWLPRISATYRVYKELYLLGSLSYGNSNPTVFEQIEIQQYSSATAFAESKNLKPETGINREVGVRYYISNFSFDFSAYDFDLTNAILPYTQLGYFEPTGAEEEFTLYSNAGSVKQQGIEGTVNYTVNLTNQKVLRTLNVWVAGQLTDYRFNHYKLGSDDFEGKAIPGMPKATLSSGLVAGFYKNLATWSVQHYYVDRTPLNNSNTDWSSSYHLLNSRVDFRLPFLDVFHWGIEGISVFVGANNILNTKYTSFLQTNAAAQRYYNPSPPRNFFAGITLEV
jgi:iron complex outermembrane receptor protein